MKRNLVIWFLLYAACPSTAQPPAAVQLPPRGSAYTDPASRNRVWRVTDSGLCPGGGRHTYSYWPVWNKDGSHLLVECMGWKGGREQSTPLLVRDRDLQVLGDALRGAPGGIYPGRLFWAWNDSQTFFADRGIELWRWNPFQRTGKLLHSFAGQKVGQARVRHARLAYVSFDDRYLLAELQGENPRKQNPSEWDVIGLATVDLQSGKIAGILDVSGFVFFDEAVITRDHHVWVVAHVGRKHTESLRYPPDFSRHIRVMEAGHHAHGRLANGTPVAVKEAGNRDCPAGTASGNPRDAEYPERGWKPTAVLVDETVDTTGGDRGTPLPNELLKLGCSVPGQHHFAHFSWNHPSGDFLFLSTDSYGDYATDRLAHGIFRVRLVLDGTGKVQRDEFDLLAHHRSDTKVGYWAQPRASCNQQGTRCLFASTMSVATDNARRQPHLYIVEVPPLPGR